jgi:hypothetical protein
MRKIGRPWRHRWCSILLEYHFWVSRRNGRIVRVTRRLFPYFVTRRNTVKRVCRNLTR